MFKEQMFCRVVDRYLFRHHVQLVSIFADFAILFPLNIGSGAWTANRLSYSIVTIVEIIITLNRSSLYSTWVGVFSNGYHFFVWRLLGYLWLANPKRVLL